MPGLCLYGTVLNSVNTVEASIRSVYRPDAEIVVVDGGSRDGTYERLLELSKDYNVKVYRLPGSTRGRGRDYALRMCPEGSYAAYFDLDDEYNAYFHRAIEWGMATESQRPLYYLVKRDYAIARGGWRDLNYAEDIEFFTRVGFDYYLPLITSRPVVRHWSSGRAEAQRYGRGSISRALRLIRMTIDDIRGGAYSFTEFASTIRRAHYRLASPLVYAAAAAMGIYRNAEGVSNKVAYFRAVLERLVNPVEAIGADPADVIVIVEYLPALRLGLGWAAGRIAAAGLSPLVCKMDTRDALVGVGSEEAVRRWPRAPLHSCKTIAVTSPAPTLSSRSFHDHS
ncbi:Glycosyltransferase [Acidilobus saccharovorans 345-15]|uniref:Glycosyltransferase n=1 Tax=Acidilobus saccharovorans (strain DSM 16705 / JCM 18335 / VKM B-2471 / 345-15) TaxID=666510 RepID=D9Q131_ACIS3|nr:glycosyltransferase [Acidilobus saccharovorans]ADL19019.1 Glycosyltransferase [Acidilobus saccharovorans 345-15]